jgi:hypothetical protein
VTERRPSPTSLRSGELYETNLLLDDALAAQRVSAEPTPPCGVWAPVHYPTEREVTLANIAKHVRPGHLLVDKKSVIALTLGRGTA